jgi:HD-like signal output (HDOD) protein
MIARGELTLPVLPDVVFRLKQELGRPHSDARRIAGWIGTEPVVAAALLRAANSAYYSGVRPIADLGQAIARLGMSAVSSVVVSSALKGQFASKNPRLGRLLDKLWGNSIASAAAGRVLCQRVNLDGEEGFVAGLLHGIGRLVVLRTLDMIEGETPDSLPDDAALHDLIESVQMPIGRLVLETWKMPEPICECVDAVTNDGVGDPQIRLIDAIRAANVITRKLGFHLRPEPQLELIKEPAIQKLGFDDMEVATLAVELEEVVQAVRGLL